MPKLGEDHPVFAAVWSYMHKGMNRYRPPVVGGAQGHVLEIGAGGGENLPYYGPVERLTLTEPDPSMLRRAEAKVRRASRPVELVPAAAESLPFPDRSFDTVVATLVFCSVEDQQAALAEVRRVLKPGGTFRFMEHVRSERPFFAKLQDVWAPVSRCVGAGCHPNRDTLGALQRAGFELRDVQRLKPGFPLYAGVAAPR